MQNDDIVKPPRGAIANLKNIAACLILVETLRDRELSLPGIGVFHGPSGYGKTVAATFVQNKTQALRVEVGDSWTRKHFLKKVLEEAGEQNMRGSNAELTERVIHTLGSDYGRPLIIDEADKLVDKNMIEMVREIADGTDAPVLLIGEEQLPSKIMRVERMHNRVLDWVAAQPCDFEDTRQLALLFCSKITLEDDLIQLVQKRSQGRARRIVVNMHKINEFARNNGLSNLNAQAYQGGFYTGEPPVRTRGMR